MQASIEEWVGPKVESCTASKTVALIVASAIPAIAEASSQLLKESDTDGNYLLPSLDKERPN